MKGGGGSNGRDCVTAVKCFTVNQDCTDSSGDTLASLAAASDAGPRL